MVYTQGAVVLVVQAADTVGTPGAVDTASYCSCALHLFLIQIQVRSVDDSDVRFYTLIDTAT